MILKICFLYTLCGMVSSVPVIPIIPSQTYPIYQSNDYKIAPLNPTNDFNPYLQQNTAQNAPPFVYQQNDYGMQPLTPINDFNPYLLQNTAQNASPINFKQILLNKILSRPSLQAILDTNAASYGLNEMATPKVINNYIILPMECPNVNKTDINQDISLNKEEIKTDSKSNKKDTKKKSKRKPRNEQDKAKVETDNNTPKPVNKDLTTKQKHPSQTREKKSGAMNDRNERVNNRDGKKRKQRQNELTEIKDGVGAINKTELNITAPPKRRRKKTEIDVNNTSKSDLNVIKQPIADITSPKVSNADSHIKIPIKEEDSERMVPIATKKDAGNDFLKTFPNINEDMAKHFMVGMNQFNDPQLMSFFGNYEQFYQSFVTGTQDATKKIKKRRKSKKNKRNRRRNQKTKARNENNDINSNKTLLNGNNITTNSNKTNNTDSASNLIKFKVSLNPVTVTTEKTKPINLESKPHVSEIGNLDSTLILEVPKSIDTPPVEGKIANSDTEDQLDELDAKEDDGNDEFDTPTMYYGLIDDYYPMFTDNAAYANEMRIKSLDSDRLFYTSDDIEDTDYDYPKRDVNDKETNIESIEHITERNINEDDIQFRQPPLLEIPDFITRQVERSEIRLNRFDDDIDLNDRVYVPDCNDKCSSYSNAKSTSSHKESRSKLNNDVETVYARSKVVKYGQVESSEEDTNDQIDWDSFQNGDTTYVIAKSLDPGQLW